MEMSATDHGDVRDNHADVRDNPGDVHDNHGDVCDNMKMFATIMMILGQFAEPHPFNLVVSRVRK